MVESHLENLLKDMKGFKFIETLEVTGKVLDQPDVKDTLHKLHANYVLVPADKAANNVIIVCKEYYIDTLVKELGINNVNINIYSNR